MKSHQNLKLLSVESQVMCHFWRKNRRLLKSIIIFVLTCWNYLVTYRRVPEIRWVLKLPRENGFRQVEESRLKSIFNFWPILLQALLEKMKDHHKYIKNMGKKCRNTCSTCPFKSIFILISAGYFKKSYFGYLIRHYAWNHFEW